MRIVSTSKFNNIMITKQNLKNLGKYMNVKWVNKVYSDGKHNAFTGLAYFNGKYYLVFRNGSGHAIFDESYQIIMTSSDGKKWDILQRNRMPDINGMTIDYRDSYFLPQDESLLLYSSCTPVNNGKRQESYTQVQIITQESERMYKPQIGHCNGFLWKPIKIKNTFYVAGYSGNTLDNYQIDFYFSDNGLNWQKKSHLAPGSETVLYSPAPDKLIAFVRTESPPYYLELYESTKPFNVWKKTNEIHKIIQGHHVVQTNKKVYLLGRERPDYRQTANPEKSSYPQHRTKVWLFENNTLEEILELPSMGDTAYPGTAIMPDNMLLVSYYSQPEDMNGELKPKTADIFVAGIKIP